VQGASNGATALALLLASLLVSLLASLLALLLASALDLIDRRANLRVARRRLVLAPADLYPCAASLGIRIRSQRLPGR